MVLLVPVLLLYDDRRIHRKRPELLLWPCHSRKLRNCDVDSLPRDNNERLQACGGESPHLVKAGEEFIAPVQK